MKAAHWFFFIAVGWASLSNCASHETQKGENPKIYWSDGDSGRIGTIKFRLANVDAPETGGVGARGGAACEAERKLGFEAKAYMVALSDGNNVTITRNYGADLYGRLVVDLNIDGKDVATLGLSSGHLRAWPHRGSKALTEKPDWCSEA